MFSDVSTKHYNSQYIYISGCKYEKNIILNIKKIRSVQHVKEFTPSIITASKQKALRTKVADSQESKAQ